MNELHVQLREIRLWGEEEILKEQLSGIPSWEFDLFIKFLRLFIYRMSPFSIHIRSENVYEGPNTVSMPLLQ